VIGALGEDLPAAARGALLGHAGTTTATELDPGALPDGPQLIAGGTGADFAVCVHRVPAGAALHLIRYDHDEAADAVPPLTELVLDLRLPATFTRATAFSPGGGLGVSLSAEDGRHRLRLEAVPLYGIVLLEG
jgi:hypothetical protein